MHQSIGNFPTGDPHQQVIQTAHLYLSLYLSLSLSIALKQHPSHLSTHLTHLTPPDAQPTLLISGRRLEPHRRSLGTQRPPELGPMESLRLHERFFFHESTYHEAEFGEHED